MVLWPAPVLPAGPRCVTADRTINPVSHAVPLGRSVPRPRRPTSADQQILQCDAAPGERGLDRSGWPNTVHGRRRRRNLISRAWRETPALPGAQMAGRTLGCQRRRRSRCLVNTPSSSADRTAVAPVINPEYRRRALVSPVRPDGRQEVLYYIVSDAGEHRFRVELDAPDGMLTVADPHH